MTAQAALWTASGAATVLAVLASLAEWARNRRRNLDRVGFMPWQLISVLAFFLAVGLAALAAHS
ncbi:MAG TPA: hypothetical protein VGB79_03875 [Allosphingosinicella sp.]